MTTRSSTPTAADTTPAQTDADTGTDTQATAEPAPPPEPEVARISVKGGVVVGDVQVDRGRQGRHRAHRGHLRRADEIHLHGYDIEREAAPGKPARFRFKADAEGAFELESHAAEHAGNEPLIARLLVGPS